MGIQGKGDPNKNFIFNHLNSNDDFKPFASVPSPPTPSTPVKVEYCESRLCETNS